MYERPHNPLIHFSDVIFLNDEWPQRILQMSITYEDVQVKPVAFHEVLVNEKSQDYLMVKEVTLISTQREK